MKLCLFFNLTDYNCVNINIWTFSWKGQTFLLVVLQCIVIHVFCYKRCTLCEELAAEKGKHSIGTVCVFTGSVTGVSYELYWGWCYHSAVTQIVFSAHLWNSISPSSQVKTISRISAMTKLQLLVAISLTFNGKIKFYSFCQIHTCALGRYELPWISYFIWKISDIKDDFPYQFLYTCRWKICK